MKEIATLRFDDVEGQGTGVVIIRAAPGSIGLCVSLRENGDVECFVSSELAGQLVEALRAAAEYAGAPQGT